MVVETTNIRTSEFEVGDVVMLHPNLRDDFFGEARVATVIEVNAATDSKPYTFSYLCENLEGEREFYPQRSLLLFTPICNNEFLSVSEESKVSSEYEVGDAYYTPKGRIGSVVSVMPKYTKDNIPYFKYLVEFKDRTRKLFV